MSDYDSLDYRYEVVCSHATLLVPPTHAIRKVCHAEKAAALSEHFQQFMPHIVLKTANKTVQEAHL